MSSEDLCFFNPVFNVIIGPYSGGNSRNWKSEGTVDANIVSVAGAAVLTIEAFVKPAQNRQAVIIRDCGDSSSDVGYWLDMTAESKFPFHIGTDKAIDISIYLNFSSCLFFN